MLRALFVARQRFVSNAHAQTINCKQLFASKSTNQYWECCKVNDNVQRGQHSTVQCGQSQHCSMWTAQHCSMWTAQHCSIWAAQHCSMWTAQHCSMWTAQHCSMWTAQHCSMWTAQHCSIHNIYCLIWEVQYCSMWATLPTQHFSMWIVQHCWFVPPFRMANFPYPFSDAARAQRHSNSLYFVSQVSPYSIM